MKQTIEIEVPDGKKAIWKDGKVIFEDIKFQLPKTWEEFCDMKKSNKFEAFINNGSNCIELGGFKKRDYYNDKNILPSKKAAEAHLALMQLHQLRNCYRQGWIPIKDNSTFVITKGINGNLRICNFIYSSGFLSFQSREIAEEFLHNFKNLIEQAGDLI